jgi:hypothetical protein
VTEYQPRHSDSALRVATPTDLLEADARNRALRVLLTNLAIDVGVAVALTLSVALADAQEWSDLQWKLLSMSLAKSVSAAIGSYLLRRVVDPSRIPTPLPPSPPGPPAEPNPGGESPVQP